MCGVNSCSVAVMKWLVRSAGRIVLRRYGLIVEFWQQFALRVALCLVTSAIFICGVEYFAPSNSECIFRCFELPLLLFQATSSGDEPFVEVLLLQQLVRREVVRTIIFAGDGLFELFTQVALFGWLLDGMFVVRHSSVRPGLWLGLYGCCLC